jgi:hypothetical protein
MKLNAVVLAAALFAVPALSQPVEPSAVLQSGAGSRLVIGAAGTVQGVNQVFETHLMLVNFRDVEQNIRVDFLAQGVANPQPQTETLTLGPSSFLSRTVPWSGLGSLVITAVTAQGAEDTAARISAVGRIYSGDACGSGTISQSFKAERVGTISGGASAYIIGLQQGQIFRTNVGVVNLDPDQAHTFAIRASGQGGIGTSEITVPPMSMRQVPVPEACLNDVCGGPFGELVVTVDPDGTPGHWFAYGSSVHNGSGDAWVVSAIQLNTP